MALGREWSATAAADLDDAVEAIARSNPAAAEAMRDLIVGKAAGLRANPYLYRHGIVPGTRELVAHPSYLLVDEVRDGAARILQAIHTARRYF